MIDYDDLMKRILLQSNTEEETNKVVEHISSLDKQEFFTFLKSMALLVVTQQQELRSLKENPAQSSDKPSDSSN
jgi:hypothetical protein